MKVNAISDIHLEFFDKNTKLPEIGEGDVLILGGDILCARHLSKKGMSREIYLEFLKQCVSRYDNVIYLLGNHEHYSLNYDKTIKIIREHIPKEINVLENELIKIKDWVFLCCTLWTDFFNENPLEMMDSCRFMSDYRAIRIDSTYRKLRPEDTLYFHKKSKEFLTEKVKEFKNDKIWIATHHAPSLQSIHEKYKSQPLNGAFVSDLDNFILDNPQIKYFSHGHTHESFDYMIGNCRVLCNPHGYYNGVNSSDLNPNFIPNLEIVL